MTVPSGGGRRRWMAAAAVLLLAAEALAVWYVGTERTLYKDDHVAYWSLSADLAGLLRRDPAAAVAATARSVSERELNLLPAVPVAVVMQLAGTSRLAYVAIVMALYAVPAMLALAWLAARSAASPAGARAAPLAVVAVILWVPALWQPVVLGYVGAGGVALAGLAWVGYLEASARRDRAAVPAVAAGAAAAFAALYRRWLGIGTAGFVAAVAVDGVVRAMSARRGERLRAAAPAAVTIATTVAALAVMAFPRLATVAATDYGDAFAAWNRTAAAGDVAASVSRYGLLPVILLAGLAAVALVHRRSRRPVLLLGVQTVVAWILFHRIQDPSPQHWYLWLPWLVVAATVGLASFAGRLRAGWAVAGATAVVAGGIAVSVAATVTPAATRAAGARALGPPALIPAVRGDLDEIRRLLATLDARLRERPGPVYVLASAGPVTDTSLGFANMSLGASYLAPRFVLSSAHVDRRDGFPENLLIARYVVLPLPVQVPDPPVHHRVVTEPAAQVVSGAGVGAALRRAPERFLLDGGVEVLLWERVRSSTPAEVGALSAALRAWYPDRPFIWRPGAAPDGRG